MKINKKIKETLQWFLSILFLISTIGLGWLLAFQHEIKRDTKTAILIIEENKNIIKSIAPDKDFNSVLFNEIYSNEQFEEDLKLFLYIREQEIQSISKSPKFINKDGSIDKRYLSDMKIFQKVLFLNIKNKNINAKKFYDYFEYNSNYERRKEFPQRYKLLALLPLFSKDGMGVGAFSYDNLKNAFDKKYGENSYIDYFVQKDKTKYKIEHGFLTDVVRIDEDEEDEDGIDNKSFNQLGNEIEQLYKDKNTTKLKQIFKQNREFLNYLSSFNLGNIMISGMYVKKDKNFMISQEAINIIRRYYMNKLDEKDKENINSENFKEAMNVAWYY